ncbi:hypothetical protein LCGC14_0529400 [marine sediment metagenome]|uniref:Uncharacterized protein n=1 Tax=marine sediment metagenome TaxID=412755 RepID=A0A0F9UHM4_9ZZZZ
MIKRLALWVFDTEWIPLGPLAPYVLGLGLGRMPHRVRDDGKGESHGNDRTS